MRKEKLDHVIKLSAEQRYFYFIRKVADTQRVWSLYNDGWVLLANEKDEEVLPFWPEKEFAQICANDLWEGSTPKSISLSNFLKKWLVGMERDGKLVGIFYIPEGKGIIVDARKLIIDLEEELEQYY